jgi:hypothetical protein
MLNSVSLQAVALARTGSDSAVDLKIATASESSPQAEPVQAASLITNPTLRLDAALGLVVIEFRNRTGAITTSIPSQRQIEAYQRWAQTHSGEAPTQLAPGAPLSGS